MLYCRNWWKFILCKKRNLLKDALGIELDEDANVNGQGDRLISTPNSKVKVFVIPTNEELVIARDTKRLLNL